jgi:hypothetical protein
VHSDPSGEFVDEGGDTFEGPPNPDPKGHEYVDQNTFALGQMRNDPESSAGANGYLETGKLDSDALTDVIFDTTLGLGASGAASAAGKAINNFLWSPSLPKVFWSGSTTCKDAAKELATSIGGKTLEMTPIGKAMDIMGNVPILKDIVRPLWSDMSSKFATNTYGPATVVQSMSAGVRTSSIWAKSEFPTLINQGNQITFKLIP